VRTQIEGGRQPFETVSRSSLDRLSSCERARKPLENPMVGFTMALSFLCGIVLFDLRERRLAQCMQDILEIVGILKLREEPGAMFFP
jgi:hypothetical protein